jgi:hypothetical protein
MYMKHMKKEGETRSKTTQFRGAEKGEEERAGGCIPLVIMICLIKK